MAKSSSSDLRNKDTKDKAAKAFIARNRKAGRVLRAKFIQRVIDERPVLSEQGSRFEYNRPNDYLYITIGNARPGIAIPFGPVMAIADPDTLELVGIEIPFFMEQIREEKLAEIWHCIATWFSYSDIVYLPPESQVRKISNQIKKELQPA